MRFLLALILAVVSLAPGIRPVTGVAQAQSTGPGGIAQLEARLETLPYTQAAPSDVLTYTSIVLDEVGTSPDAPSPREVKDGDLRKQLLALRLMMDLNAFAYDPRSFNAYRDAVDAAYEDMGSYQDLYVTQQLAGTPIDPDQQAERLVALQAALAPFRLESFRAELEGFFSRPAPRLVELDTKDRPRLWQIADTGPSDDLDSMGNAALLGQRVLRNLIGEGLLVDDILDPDQEARFHDVRKALRSVMDLADMYPSLAAATSDVREPVSALVSACGDVNDEFVAYHAAQEGGDDVGARAAAVQAAYATVQSQATEFVNSGRLEAYAARLASVQANHAATPTVASAAAPSAVPAQAGPAQAGSSIGALRFAADVTGKSEPVNPRIEFSRDNQGVWVTFEYANLPAGSRLTRIVRFNGDDFNWDSGQFGHLRCCPAGGSGQFAFRVLRLTGDAGWLPGGAYEVRIFLDGSEVAHGGFGIDGARGSGRQIPGGHNGPNH